jgi:PKD repeat protein
MKHFYFFIALFLLSARLYSANILIARPATTIYSMDTVWRFAATNMGYNATIISDTVLDNTFFISNTDVLVLSDLNITYTPTRLTNIISFLQTGKSVYLQSEYDMTFTGNQAFQSIVNTLGGSFSWAGTVAGVLAPMNVLGTLATTPITIPPLTYFWYGCNANICNYFDSFLEFGGQYFGFTFCPPSPTTGRLMTTSDQDWIQGLTSTDLMQNMLALLLTPPSACGFGATPVSLGNDTTLCTGDHLLLGSGITGTSYLWSNGATTNVILVDTSGNYWLQVTVAGCTALDTINIQFNPCSIDAQFIPVDATICPGTCTGFTDLSLNAASYVWSFPGGNPSVSIDPNPSNICYTTPGTYDVTLVVTNGILSDTLIFSNCITVFPTPPAQGILQYGDTLFSNQGSVAYQWYHSGNLIPGATNYFYVADTSGSFSVIATDENGCEVEAVINNVIAEIQLPFSSSQFAAFPNPVFDKLTIAPANSVQVSNIRIYNILGEKVFEIPSTVLNQVSEYEISCSRFTKGIYILEVTVNNQSYRSRITKQ